MAIKAWCTCYLWRYWMWSALCSREGCFVTPLRVVSHVVLTNCEVFPRAEWKAVVFSEAMRRRSLPRVASVVLLRAWGVLAACPTGQWGCWLKTTRKAGYSRGWEKQSNCQRGHKMATAEEKDTTHSLTALSVILPSRWGEGGRRPPCAGVDSGMLNILSLHLFRLMANKLFTCHFTLLKQSQCLLSHLEFVSVCSHKGQRWRDNTALHAACCEVFDVWGWNTDKIKDDEIMIKLINSL